MACHYAFNSGVLVVRLPLGPLWLKHDANLTSEFTFNLFGSWSGLLGYHMYYPSLQFVFNFPLATTSKEVGCSPKDPKLLNNICNFSHSSIKLLGDGLIGFTLNMLVYNFLSNLLKKALPFAFCGPFSVWFTP